MLGAEGESVEKKTPFLKTTQGKMTARLIVLELCHRAGEGRCGQGSGRHSDHAGPGPEHGLADEEAV